MVSASNSDHISPRPRTVGPASALVWADQVRSLYQHVLGNLLLAPLSWILLAALMWPAAGAQTVWFSLALLAGAALAQLAVTLAFYFRRPPVARYLAWCRAQFVMIALAGAAWGLVGMVLYHALPDLTYHAILLLFIGAMAAVVLVAYAVMPLAYFLFVIPMCAPVLVLLLGEDDAVSRMLALALIAYVVVMTIYMWQACVSIRRSFRLRYENQALLDHLIAAREETEQANNELRHANEELSEALGRIRQLAAHDDLTGLPNRRYLMTALENERARCERAGESFSVCIIDIDHFKRVNDTHGHISGDSVLQAFAACGLRNVRDADVFGRFGGEEFLLILPGTPREAATQLVERLRVKVARHDFGVTSVSERLTISAGVAEYRPGEPLSELLGRTDQALYRAKREGRDRVIAVD